MKKILIIVLSVMCLGLVSCRTDPSNVPEVDELLEEPTKEESTKEESTKEEVVVEPTEPIVVDDEPKPTEPIVVVKVFEPSHYSMAKENVINTSNNTEGNLYFYKTLEDMEQDFNFDTTTFDYTKVEGVVIKRDVVDDFGIKNSVSDNYLVFDYKAKEGKNNIMVAKITLVGNTIGKVARYNEEYTLKDIH